LPRGRIVYAGLNGRPHGTAWDRKDLTALIHVLKRPQNSENFINHYFNKNLRKLQFPDATCYKIMQEFRALPEEALGYTGVGLSAITKIDLPEVGEVGYFVEGLHAATTFKNL
jgi:hypothetical protein